MIVYLNKSDIQNIQTTVQYQTAIASLQNIINTLMAAAAAAALNANIQAYRYDDGQSKTNMEYRDVKAIAAQIMAFTALQQMYLQMPNMNGRMMRLIDSKNFPNFFCGNSTTTCV